MTKTKGIVRQGRMKSECLNGLVLKPGFRLSVTNDREYLTPSALLN